MSAGQPRWGAIALVCGTYFAATVGEQLLSPLFPTARDDLGLSEGQGGIAFGVLALAIAVFNMVSGVALRRWSAITVIRCSTIVTATGAVAAAMADEYASVLVAQVLLGAGAGLVLPGRPAGRGDLRRTEPSRLCDGHLRRRVQPRARRRRAARRARRLVRMAGLVLDRRRARRRPRSSSTSRMTTERPVRGARWSLPWRAVLGLPTIVGTVGAILQYGVLAFFATYAVDEWELSEGAGGDRARRRPARLDRGQARRRGQRRPHRAARERRAHRRAALGDRRAVGVAPGGAS